MQNKQNQNKEEFIRYKDSLSFAAYTAYFFTILSIIYKVFVNSNFSSYLFEIILIIVMTLSIFTHRIMNKVYNLPVKIFGKRKLDFSKQGLKSRLIHYFKDTIVFSILYFSIVHVFLKKQYLFAQVTENVILQISLELLFTFFIVFMTDFVWFETNVSLYEKEKRKRNS
ncbi:hypothetical protein [Fusibacter bizertensis]